MGHASFFGRKAYAHGEWPFMASWDSNSLYSAGGYWEIHIDGQTLRDPTHWHPLPEPPVAEQEEAA